MKCSEGLDVFNSRDRLFPATVVSMSAQLSEILYRFYESGQVASKGTLMLSLDDRILDNWKRGTRSTVKSHHALGVLWLLELSA